MGRKVIRNSVSTFDLVKFEVDEDGIYKPFISGPDVFKQMLIPREIFVEAYNKYIVEENRKKKLSYRLYNWFKNISSKFNHYINKQTKETEKSKEN